MTQTSGLSAARMSSKSPSLLTLRGANSVMSTSPAHSSRCLMSSQLRPPPPAAVAAAGAHEHPRSLQLVAVERELQVALLQRRVDVVGLRRPRALIPEHDDAGAVALGDHALERAVLDTDDPRRASPAAWSWDRATVPWARPTRAARRCARAGSRSAGGSRGASARRRTGPSPARLSSRARRRAVGSPAGSGVLLKLRFCRYFSRAMAIST